jgi:hypothetical protein
VERKARTRRATAAERHAARALGRPEPDEVEVDVTASAQQHAARLQEVPKSVKPKDVQTFDWYAQRSLGGVQADEGLREAAVEEEDRSVQLPAWARRLTYRPGGDAA